MQKENPLNGILYRACAARTDNTDPEVWVFFECPPLVEPEHALTTMLSVIWFARSEDIEVCNLLSEQELLTTWCISASARCGAARLFETGIGDGGRVHYADAERTLFLVGSPTLARLIEGQRLAQALFAVGFVVDADKPRGRRTGVASSATAEEAAA